MNGYAIFTNQNDVTDPEAILLEGVRADQVKLIVYITKDVVAFQNTGLSALQWANRYDQANPASFINMDPKHLYTLEIGTEADVLFPVVTLTGAWVLARLHFDFPRINECFVTLKIQY